MGDNSLTLYFSLAEHVEIPVGSWCEFQAEKYTLLKPEDFIMHHSRNFEYTVIMSSDSARVNWYKLRNPVDSRLKFSYTATPKEHLQMLVDNLNERGGGWSVGDCIASAEKVITYNHTYCLDALTQMAETFKTEYEIDRQRISLKKVEYNKDNPLPLSYGKGNGFRPGIGRTNYEDSIPVAALYVQGGSRNIDASKYGTSELLLPKNAVLRYDGNKFEDESGFNPENARIYVTDSEGYSITRKDRAVDGKEDSLDCSEIYPHRDETIKEVILVDADKHWYDIVTDTPSSLVYSKYGIGGEVPTIVFQDGELAGREFDLETDNDGNIICEIVTTDDGISGWKFQIVPSEIDGITMPGGSFIPKAGDTFRIFGIQLPDEYIADGETKSGASWEMFREGVRYLYGKEDRRFTFTGELDGIWAKKDWLNIGGKIKLGGFISFTDDRFQKDPVLIRITGIKEYINNPYSPEIELSNSTIGGTVANDLNQIENDKAAAEEMFNNSISYTKRRFRDAKETISMLEDAMLKNFTDSISPIAIQTMMMLVGDESLQFRFVDSMTSPQPVIHNVTYDTEHKVLIIPEGIIQHMTLGITSVSTKNGHSISEYRFWSIPAFESPVLDVPEKKYYLYVRVSRTGQDGVFYMSETAVSMEAENDVYYLLMGLLNSEYEDSRSYVSLYGFTEILPGQVTTDTLRDPDGNLVIDLARALITAKNGARIDGNIHIGPGSSGLENLEEWEDKQQALEDAQDAADKAQETADTAKNTIAGWVDDGVISPLEKQGLKDEFARIKADYQDVQSGYNKYGLGNPTDYNLAYAEYYNVLSEILSSPEQNVPVPDNFDSIQNTYYDRWVDALEAIAAAAKDAVSQAQDDANQAQNTADEALQKAQEAKDYIDNTLPEEIANINKKLDGVVETWFYPYSPTTSNEPAASWIRDGEQEKHIGDMFLNNQEYVDEETTPDAGKAWRWEKNTSGDYFWNQVADSDAVKALQDAAKAQDTADQKRRVFVTTPYPPYDVGDMWTQGPSGDIMRCVKARATGSYTASDWDRASKYTDDALAQDALNKAQQAQDAADKAQDVADAAQAAASKAQNTADSAVVDASEANKQLTNLMSDSVITPPEKTALKQQHSDIKAEYSQIISDAQKYGVSTSAYTSAYNSANTALTKYTAASPENITVGSDYNNISAYYTARQTILNAIAAAAKKVADDAQSAADDAQDAADAAQNTANQAAQDASKAMQDAAAAQAAVQSVRGDLNNLNDTVSDLDEYIDGAFRDGVIDSAESIAIQKYLNVVNESWSDVQGSYTTVYNNPYLTGSAKTNLNSAYNTLSQRRTTLVNRINTAVSNPSTTNINNMNSAFDSYNTAMQQFRVELENANEAIQEQTNLMAKLLASASMGKMLYDDPEFKNGTNSIRKYYSSGSSLVTIARKQITNIPNSSGYGLEIVSLADNDSESLYPGRGGFTFNTPTKANQMLLCRFIAKVPEGRIVQFNSNSTGNNTTRMWLTEHIGTGNWEEYAVYVKAGDSGTFSTTFYFFIDGSDPVTWYISYATVFDLSSASDLIERMSDIEYLETVFPNSNLISEGALIGRMVGVTDRSPSESGAKVVAGLNGTSTGSDTTYGKALIFAGSDGVTDSAIKNATTIIYESGRIKSKDVDLEGKISATSGQIGKLKIDSEGWLLSSSENTSMALNADAFNINNKGYKNYEASFNIRTIFSSIIGTNDNTFVNIKQDRVDSSLYGKYVQNVALNVSAAGASTGFHLTNGSQRPYRFDGNFAIRCAAGMFAGLRPMTRRIPGINGTTTYDDEEYLTRDDCIIICKGTNISINIYLPGNTSDPKSEYYLQNGQYYQIWMTGTAQRVIHAQGGRVINWSGIQSGSTQTLGTTDYRVVHLVYCEQESQWLMFAPPKE